MDVICILVVLMIFASVLAHKIRVLEKRIESLEYGNEEEVD
jgi:hypothetical protein